MKKHLYAFSVLATVAGATGATGATGVTGKVRFVQNRRWVIASGHLRGLIPKAQYSVMLHADNDGQGCASNANPALDPPRFRTVTANDDGNGNTKAKVRTRRFALDRSADYYVAAHDASGAMVSCGDLVLKKKHKPGKGKGHR
jgi:hypothetical protein